MNMHVGALEPAPIKLEQTCKVVHRDGVREEAKVVWIDDGRPDKTLRLHITVETVTGNLYDFRRKSEFEWIEMEENELSGRWSQVDRGCSLIMGIE